MCQDNLPVHKGHAEIQASARSHATTSTHRTDVGFGPSFAEDHSISRCPQIKLWHHWLKQLKQQVTISVTSSEIACYTKLILRCSFAFYIGGVDPCSVDRRSAESPREQTCHLRLPAAALDDKFVVEDVSAFEFSSCS